MFLTAIELWLRIVVQEGAAYFALGVDLHFGRLVVATDIGIGETRVCRGRALQRILQSAGTEVALFGVWQLWVHRAFGVPQTRPIGLANYAGGAAAGFLAGAAACCSTANSCSDMAAAIRRS